MANSGNTSGSTVSEFAPGSTIPTATLTGLDVPVALAFDSSGDLFVANSEGGSTAGSVSEFAPGGITPIATLIGGRHPEALVFDKSGDLFVADDAAISPSVTEFAPGSTTPTLVIDPNGHFGTALAFDSSGNLYELDTLGSAILKFAGAHGKRDARRLK